MRSIFQFIGICIILFVSLFLWFCLDKKDVPIIKDNIVDKQENNIKIDDILVTIKRSNGSVVMEELEKYIVGVVASEMPATFALEALKAQSVAARTFVKQRGFVVDDTTSSQVYKSEEELRVQWNKDYDEKINIIKEACRATKGEIITYNGEAISAVFFSSSCGKTNNASEYWQKVTPYLVSVDSHWDKEVNDQVTQSKVLSRQEIGQKLGFQSFVSQIGTPTYYSSGYVKAVIIDGIVFSGRELREKLSLRSSSFEISENEDEITFITNGYGHGIGMSQYGAQGMAIEGYKYLDILKHYYTDVKIEKIKV
ncbi:MAG: stage II sporulation protein D [Erysipelotrichaceae bacterium]